MTLLRRRRPKCKLDLFFWKPWALEFDVDTYLLVLSRFTYTVVIVSVLVSTLAAVWILSFVLKVLLRGSRVSGKKIGFPPLSYRRYKNTKGSGGWHHRPPSSNLYLLGRTFFTLARLIAGGEAVFIVFLGLVAGQEEEGLNPIHWLTSRGSYLATPIRSTIQCVVVPPQQETEPRPRYVAEILCVELDLTTTRKLAAVES
jgi:hypothetical protein